MRLWVDQWALEAKCCYRPSLEQWRNTRHRGRDGDFLNRGYFPGNMEGLAGWKVRGPMIDPGRKLF